MPKMDRGATVSGPEMMVCRTYTSHWSLVDEPHFQSSTHSEMDDEPRFRRTTFSPSVPLRASRRARHPLRQAGRLPIAALLALRIKHSQG